MSAHDPFRLDGQTAVVTAGGRGLGRATALALAAAGADVWVGYRESAAAARAVVADIAALGRRGRAIEADVSAEGVRVNAIAPGPLRSPMTDPFATPEWVAAKLTSQILPHLGEVEGVAATAVILASDTDSLSLGQTLSPNAGGVM